LLLTSAGRLTLSNQVTSAGFESDGTLTINPAATLTHSGGSLVLGGGSRTFIGSSASRGGTLIVGSGDTLELNGALLINNGTIDGTTNINYGSLAKGAGRYGQINVTDGGRFSPGNSPGSVTTGPTTWNSGGTYIVELADAGGVPGTGWDFWDIDGLLGLN